MSLDRGVSTPSAYAISFSRYQWIWGDGGRIDLNSPTSRYLPSPSGLTIGANCYNLVDTAFSEPGKLNR
ncbi:MAG TPA: hypothetical protein DEA79_24560 [Cyanobacteria bacterium UBA11153]|nr:hypothetical protein [Cyanobacteria bacterium UBA11153]